jgi:hypothetical protein
MKTLSLDLRERIVAAYDAEVFRVTLFQEHFFMIKAGIVMFLRVPGS